MAGLVPPVPGRTPRLELLAAIAGALLSWNLAACAATSRVAQPPPALQPAPATEAPPSRPPPARASPAKAERLAAQGRFRAALEEYRALRARAPGDAAILASQLRVVGGLMTAAEAEYARGDLAAAGRGYRTLLDAHPDFGALAASLPFDPATLHRKLDACVEGLIRAGLQRYRTGAIAEALELWRAVLTFEPGSVEAQRAIDGATAQQRALQDSSAATGSPASASPGR